MTTRRYPSDDMPRADLTRRWIPLISVETVGLLLAAFLTAIHFGWLGAESAPCPRGGLFACENVLRGPFSTLLGVPVALLGVVHFAMHIALTRLGARRWGWVVIKLAILVPGILFVAWLRALEILYLRKICPYCWSVALVTLLQVYLASGWLLPGWRRSTRAAGLVATFVAAIAVTLGAELAVSSLFRRRPPTEAHSTASTSAPTPTTGTATLPSNATTTTTTATATATPTFTPAESLGAPVETEETELLRKSGWIVCANAAVIDEALAKFHRILVFAYDPFCPECQATTEETLSQPGALAGLAVPRIAIEESSMQGTISDKIKKVPTLVLITSNGTILFEHTGRIGLPQLQTALEAALRKQ